NLPAQKLRSCRKHGSKSPLFTQCNVIRRLGRTVIGSLCGIITTTTTYTSHLLSQRFSAL
ncbi:MAG: hypothetical protein ACRDL7_03180, partial [Gaiellaceae bacterium]